MMREMSRISSTSMNWIILAGITAIAAVLRLWQINESLWVDELHTSWCLQAGLEKVAQRAAEGNQSPLYFYLVWAVTRLLGESEFTLRLPSLLAGIALPGMTWLLVRQFGLNMRTEIAAFLAALLVSVDHISTFYATEARPYAFVELLAVVALYLAIESDRGGFVPRTVLVAALVMLFYLNYTTALYIAAILVCFFVYSLIDSSGKPGRWTSWLAMSGATFLLCLPAVFQVLDIASRRGNWEVFVGAQTPANGYVVLVVLLALGPRLPPTRMLLATAVCLIPVLLAWGLTRWEIVPLFHTRYIVATVPVLWACIASASQVADNPRVRQIVAAVVAAVAIWWGGLLENCVRYGQPLVDRQEVWRAGIAAANQEYHQHPQWKILVHSGLIETDALRRPHNSALRNYGLLPVTALYSLDAPDENLVPLPMTNPGELTAETRNEVFQAGGAIVILRQSTKESVTAEEDLRSLGIVKRQSFGGVQILSIKASILP
jgi:mannosyltransferase